MNGILIIDKPAGITSHDVVSRVRRILNTRRVGHTGTLDPFATGVMVILVGQATRLAQFLDKDEKEYEALVRFGFETDTGDLTGLRIADCGLRTAEIDEIVSKTNWNGVFHRFRGEIEQIPPMFSAKKVDGRKLYEMARKGETIARPAVKITIYQLELLSEKEIRNPQSAIRISVVCSAGTYIRTLAEDIGRKVGTGAHLDELRRTRAGKFNIDQSVTLEKLAELTDPTSALIPLEQAVSHLPSIELTDERVEKTRNGLSTRVLDANFTDGDSVQMIDCGAHLIAMGVFNEAENIVQPKVVLI
jgi:tRNA pseudouridine55 synthase